MKQKLLLLLVAMFALTCNTAWAADDEIDFTQLSVTSTDDGFTLVSGNYSFTAAKNDGSTAPTQNSTTLDLRIYAKGTLKVENSQNAMSKMVFTVSKQGKKRLTDITASVGTVTVDSANWIVTWEYSTGTNEVTFTVGDKATYGTDGSGKAGQFDIDKVVITTSGDAPVSKKSADLAFSETSITLEPGVDDFTSPTFTKSTTAEVTFSSDNEDVATVDKNGVITIGTTLGTATITATAEENSEYNSGTATCKIELAEYNHYVKATSVESGKSYLITAILTNDSVFYAYPISSSKTYGYLYGTKSTTSNEIRIKASYDDCFVFTDYDLDGWTISQSQDSRLLYMGTKESGSFYTSFQVDSEPETAQYWTVKANSDGTFTITNNASGYYMQYSQTYKSFGCYANAQTNSILPSLYELKYSTNIGNNITVEDNTATGNNAIYNLSGQRVGKSYKGIVVKNGKKYVQK